MFRMPPAKPIFFATHSSSLESFCCYTRLLEEVALVVKGHLRVPTVSDQGVVRLVQHGELAVRDRHHGGRPERHAF